MSQAENQSGGLVNQLANQLIPELKHHIFCGDHRNCGFFQGGGVGNDSSKPEHFQSKMTEQTKLPPAVGYPSAVVRDGGTGEFFVKLEEVAGNRV